MTRKQVIRVGDRVRVINSKAVRRVGYPLVWYDLLDEVKADPRTLQAYHVLLGLPPPPPPPGLEDLEILKVEELPKYFTEACAKLQVEQRGFGGQVRSLHCFGQAERSGSLFITGVTVSDMTGRVHEVTAKRVVKTGTRVAPSGGVTYTMDGPDYWDEPGGLEDMKTHVLLMLGGFEFEQCNVELVQRK